MECLYIKYICMINTYILLEIWIFNLSYYVFEQVDWQVLAIIYFY